METLPSNCVCCCVFLVADRPDPQTEAARFCGRLVVGGGDVVAGAGAEFQVAEFGIGGGDLDFVVAALGGAGGGIAERGLRWKLAAGFGECFFVGGGLEGGVWAAAG